MSYGILGGTGVRHRRPLRGLGGASNCSDDDLINCDQSGYDSASSYCDSIGQSGDLTCIQQNMDTSKCACAGGAAAPAPSSTITVPAVTITGGSSTKKKTTPKPVVTTSVKPLPSSQASMLGFNGKTLAMGALAVVGYMVFAAKKVTGR